MKVIIEFLRSWGACPAARREFLERYPDGVELADLLVALANSGNEAWTSWFLGLLLVEGLVPFVIVPDALIKALEDAPNVPPDVIATLRLSGYSPVERLRVLAERDGVDPNLQSVFRDLWCGRGLNAYGLSEVLGVWESTATERFARALAEELLRLGGELPFGPSDPDDDYEEDEEDEDDEE